MSNAVETSSPASVRIAEVVARPRRRQRRWVRPLSIVLGPALVLIAGAYLYLTGGRYISTEDAYVRAGVAQISTDIPGRVSEIDVRENQRVKAGDTLFRLDDRPYRYALERAQAQLAQSRLTVEALRATYAQKQADLKTAEEDLDFRSRELERQRQLLASRVASQAQYDQARHNFAAARQAVEAAQQALANVLASLGGNPRIETDRHPAVLAAKAQVDQAALDLSHTVIRAAGNGIVAQVDKLQVGDYVTAGTPLFALIGTDDIWIEANFKETDLTHMKPGQAVTVEIDTYPGRRFKGKVVGISPGTGSEFSVLPPQNASGNWVKVVQRLPVRIALSESDPEMPLRAGMSATVEVDTEIRRPITRMIESALAGPWRQD